MKLEKLVECNRRGLVPGPEETEESFFARCSHQVPAGQVAESSLAKTLFDIAPDWVSVSYENKGLRLWEGGCTWIKHEGITLQLKKTFLKKKTYFGYSHDEILAHELVHATRGYFEEPIFEEILAYQTSGSRFRRLFGPLFRSARESSIFIGMLAITCVANLFSFFETIALLSVLLLSSLGIFRLLRTQSIFSRTRKKLGELVGQEKALAVMLRLTDREIIRFSKMKTSEINLYAKRLFRTDLRWKQIYACYFLINAGGVG